MPVYFLSLFGNQTLTTKQKYVFSKSKSKNRAETARLNSYELLLLLECEVDIVYLQ